MSTDDRIPEHDVTLPYAERYAQAVTIAAAAQAKIDALTEQIKDHEYYRFQAEQQVDSLRTLIDTNGGKLITSTDAAPGEEVNALLDLYGGQVYVRVKRQGGTYDPNYWIRAEVGGNPMQYEWPISDSGPFLPLPDAWFLHGVMEKAKARDEVEIRTRSHIRTRDGYRDEESGDRWSEPPLNEAVGRVVGDLERKWSEARSSFRSAEQEVRRLSAEVERWRELAQSLEAEKAAASSTVAQS